MDEEVLRRQIPHYLLTRPEAREGLKALLEDFRVDRPIYGQTSDEDPIQGDGWTGFTVVNPDTLQRKYVRGIIISNSCDISLENKRYLPPLITFVPIIDLAAILQIYLDSGTSISQMEQRLKLIRAQEITDLFYLPRGADLDVESVALLGDVHSVKLSSFAEYDERRLLLRLSQFGHYLFLFKLSIHFCRFNEDIVRQIG